MEAIAFIIIAIIVMVVTNLALDKLYGKFPLLQLIISGSFFIGSFFVLVFNYENGIAYGFLQFIGWYNLFTNVKPEEWTTKEGHAYVDSFNIMHYHERYVNHYIPAWLNKLISCLLFTGIACLISLLTKLWWTCLIPTAIEVFLSYRLYRINRTV